MMRNAVLVLIVGAALGIGKLDALDWAGWVGCIQVANSTCPLDQGTYTLPESSGQVIALRPANGVVMEGSGTSNYSTTLQRPASATGDLIYVAPGTTVTISNLTIDGNRYSFPNQYGCATQDGWCGPQGGSGCTVVNWNQVIEIDGDSGSTVNLDQLAVWNTAGSTPVYIAGGTVQWSAFYYSRSTGPWLRGETPGAVYNTSFEYNGTAGLRLSTPPSPSPMGSTVVQNSTFYQNRYEMSDGYAGGQLYIDYGASSVTVENSDFNGNNWVTPAPPTLINNCNPPTQPQGVAGVEIEPQSGVRGQNSVLGNEISGNTGGGISAHSVSGLVVSGYSAYPSAFKYVENNTGNTPPQNTPTDGIKFVAIAPYGSSTGVTLSNVLSRGNSGYAVDFGGDAAASGPGWEGQHCLQASYITSMSLTNPQPATTDTCP